uniref:Transmembrane protein 79b n=1 Tax=Electrophorus electricus TaxID=8005 RepID=A0A4W4GF29_ELEEL
TEETHNPGQVAEDGKINTDMNGTTTKNPVVDKEPSTLPWPEYKSDHPSGSRQSHMHKSIFICYSLQGRCIGTRRDVVKAAVAVLMAALIFPVLVWGGYTFLPFDAPLLDSAPLRLVYTLRCSVFAVIPIVLGILVLGVSRLRYSSLKPQCDGEPEIEAVYVHRCYVEDSISLFLLYFLQLGVMAAYLSQELLKLVPLLTIIFAFGRLVYWIAAVWGSSVRGFGFGFSFLPMLAMLVANLYFIFMADSAGSVFAQDDLGPLYLLPEKRQRFWG